MHPDVRASTRPRVVAATLLAALCLLSVSACTRAAPDPLHTASAMATEAPIFASDEEALNAARDTFEGYLRAGGSIMSEGGASPERIDDFTTPETASEEKAGFARLAARGERLVGETKLENVTLQSYRPDRIRGIVVVYACVSVADTDVLDEDGKSTVSVDRPDRTPFEAIFDRSEQSATKLRLSSKTVWAGEGVC